MSKKSNNNTHTSASLQQLDKNVGGGIKKLSYTLQTVRSIGLKDSAKALRSKNTCKACGLGMGGQQGGMTNELGEFPAVCNKSVQAQSSDTQAAIPGLTFNKPIKALRKLSAYQLEHLGRLNDPLYKASGEDHYKVVDWSWAIDHCTKKFKNADPARSFFYSSGRSSSEAGFVLQLMARMYGTNNINNCSYYCHQATSVGLANSIGVGTATIELDDLSECDLIFVIGANPASNHPRFIHKLKACRERGGQVIVINPAKEPGLVRFAVPKSVKSLLTGGSSIASEYLQPRIGGDIATLKGIAKALLAQNAQDQTFINQHTSGFDAFRADIEATDWRSIESGSGLQQGTMEAVAEQYHQAKRAVFAWGMGVTHHTHGVDNVETIANLALLRGMIGKRYAGLLPLRGHSNVQGIGTIGVKPILPADVFKKIETAFNIKLPTDPGYDTLSGLQAAAAGNIDNALIMGGNLYSASPDSRWAEQALSKITFKVFLTTTLNHSHLIGVQEGESLVLPVTARDEEWQATTQESMFNFVRLSDGGINRLNNVRPEVTILTDIATQLIDDSKIDFNSFKQHRNIREAIARCIPGMEKLADIDIAKKEFHINGRLLHTPKFMTDTGLAHFTVCDTPKTGHLSAEEGDDANDYPYTLMTIRSEGQFNTIIYEEQDSYRLTDSRWSVMLNAEDMDKLGIKQGDHVDLVSPYGKMASVKTYAFNIPYKNAMAYFPEANILIGQAIDPRSRTPAFKSVAINICKSIKNG